MRRIKPLPEAVRSSVRSGIILYDLTRVVEELVFNSLDAGATKVSVAVGVGTCFVKVADNGSGIDRDGLVLLGERYATSKHDHLADLEANDGSFGFRGEALCSISDVSVLEIITKGHGMPHGYRKVMKGCKCLYFGINDDRHDAGTTVIVRDLFYNQPVRRKHMQSSPKKVLHLVKKCVLRVALVHSMVSFKVFDIESQDELLRTCSSPSPLSLLSTNFGIETASSLYELKASKGEFKLSGYLSGPCGIVSLKAFQYIYINSRFICKGPLHKLLNQLAVVYWDSKKYNICGQNEKQSRYLPCPTFVLNLSCPRSHYDITFEPLKSAVEFMDWGPVLEFVQDTVTHFWSKNVSDDLPDYCESGRMRSRTHEWQSPVDVPFLPSEKLIEDYRLHASNDSLSSSQMSNGDASELKKHQKDAFLIRGTDSAIHLDDKSQFACRMTTNKRIHSGVSLSSSLYFDEDNILVNELSPKESCSKQIDYFLESKWQNGPFEVEDQMTMSTRSPVCANFHEFRDDADNNPVFVKQSKLSHLKGTILQDIGPSFTGEDKIKFSNADFNKRRKHVDMDNDVDVGDNNDIDEIFEENKPRHGIVKPLWLFSRCTNQHDEIIKSKSLSHDVSSSSIAGESECSDEENYLVSHSLRHDKNFGCDWLSSTSEWLPRIPNCLFSQISDADHSVGEGVHSEYGKGVQYDYFRDRKGKYCNFTCDTAGNWLDVGHCTDFLSDCKFYVGHQGDFSDGDFSDVRGHKVKDSCVTNCSGVFPDEVNWSCTNTSGKSILPNSSDRLSHTSLYTKLDRNKRARVQMGNKEAQFHKREARRSNSAPPFHKRRRKFFDLNNLLKIEAGQINSDDTTCPEITNPKHELQAFDQCHLPSKEKCVDDPLCIPRLGNEALLKRGQYISSSVSNHIGDSMSKEIPDVSNFDLKWRKSCQQDVGATRSRNAGDCDTILDISSGILHFAGDSLVPTSIDKTCLRDAKVLQQVDKKFIPVVAGSILAVIDQHAADERIRLEELRQKVLSGEMKQITYLDAEKELVLPEIGYQLLQNYKDQIQNWGWICNIYGQGSRSFAKKMNLLHRRRTVAKLVAVPCILGVNLTDSDLLEFLQQLGDTDGSSTIPPSVIRILNNKACRGAIMFGDTLLHSECSLIVEELKQTSLCFQCAHGRPTTVPLVNLDLLHKQIDKLGQCRKGTQELWHGLCRHEISLERAECRLSAAVN